MELHALNWLPYKGAKSNRREHVRRPIPGKFILIWDRARTHRRKITKACLELKFCWLLNAFGRVVAWAWDTMNVNDKRFNPLVEPFIGKTIVLADYGFRDQDGIPENMKICKKGTWNERMCLETAFSLVTVVCDLKRIRHRLAGYIQARLAFVAAMFNVLMDLFHLIHPDADPYQMSIAEFSL